MRPREAVAVAPLTVFLSSRQGELASYRDAAARAIKRRDELLKVWQFEDQPAAPIPPAEIFIPGVEESDVVLFIAGAEASEATFEEIAHALQLRKDVIAFLLPVEARANAMTQLIQRIWDRATTVEASTDLHVFEGQVDEALLAWVIRRVQAANAPNRVERLRVIREEVRFQTLLRLRAAGLDEDIAQGIVDDGLCVATDASLAFDTDRRFITIIAPAGSGKSFVAARAHDHACTAAIASALAPTPVYVRAQDADIPLRFLVERSMNGVGELRLTGAHVVIDGLDELDELRRNRLLDEAATLIETYPFVRVLAASRQQPPAHLRAHKVNLAALTREEQWALITRASRGTVDPATLLLNLSPAIREAVSRPLFAIALSLGARNAEADLRRPADLVAFLIKKGLSRTERADAVARQLQELAVRVLDSPNGLVLADEVSVEDQIALLSTRLVYEREGRFGIALRLIAEYSASRALKSGLPAAAASRIGSLALSDRWSGAWQLYLAELEDIEAWQFIDSIASGDPGLARDLCRDDKMPKTAPWESVELALTLRAAMEALAVAIPRLTPRREDGTLPTTRAAVEANGWIHSGWQDDNTKSPVALGPPPSMMTHVWSLQRSQRYSDERFLAHALAVDDVGTIIDSFIRERGFEVDFEPLATEEDWIAASGLLRRSLRDHSAVPLDLLTEQLGLCAPGRSVLITHPIHPANLTQENLRRFPILDRDRLYERVQQLRAAGAHQWEPPFPIQDESLSTFVWSGYSDQALARLRAWVLKNAMDLYALIVDEWMGSLRRRLIRRQLMPAVITERLYRSERREPIGRRCWSPLPDGSGNVANVDFAHDFDWTNAEREAAEAIEEFRAESSAALFPLQSEGRVHIFGEFPIRDTTYQWLVRDLNNIGWIASFSLEHDRA